MVDNIESFTIFDELTETIEDLQRKIKELQAKAEEVAEEREEEQRQLQAFASLVDELEHNNIINSYDLDLYFKFA